MATYAVGQQTKIPKHTDAQTQYVDVGGYKLRLQVAGAGSPVVVLDCGFGDALEVWDKVFPEVARFTRVVAYDRAGLGKSEPGRQPRSFTQIATELHTLLHRANIEPPYILVGHSMGAADVRGFAHLFKEEVAGIVFVDPISENIWTFVGEKERAAEVERQEAAMKNARLGVQEEWRFLKTESLNGFRELTSFGKLPDVPMMLLVAGRDRPPHWVKSVLEGYGNWMAEAKEGGVIFTPDSTHYIQRDEPSLVVAAIRRVVFPSVQNVLEATINEKGVEAAVGLYRQMRQRYPAEFFRESTLNSLGYQQLRAKHTRGAVALFKLNVEMYPDAFNTYDSLGEAYMVQGDREAAIQNYRKSFALNPQNTNAVEMLKKLGASP
jgi:pimeloyl-ACP methyl ester carboxylesterase